MKKKDIPKEFIELIKRINNKRANIVINHILKHGLITTEELQKNYGYNDPPRAARDVREAGIPLETIRVKSKDGNRNIAAYKFGDFKSARFDRIKGRINWPKKFKESMVKEYGSKCLISGAELEPRALQIDHRIPYQIAGDINTKKDLDVKNYMLLSSTSNRAKSWSCEHCKNWIEVHDLNICQSCYWAFPENHTHVAMNEIRRLDLTWQGDEVADYDELKRKSKKSGHELPDYVKEILKINTE
ncbi:MAG: HNH endonuclease [Bacteroidetes bacterium]|nr:MAG: HNH endonuclease [Bacteroidota bacterium]